MPSNPKQTLAEKVRKNIEHDIISGKYELGTKIPTEPMLVQQYQVGRNTIREAVQSLIHLGLLEAKQGSGTYVIANSHFNASMTNLCQNIEIKDYNEFLSLLGKNILKTLPKKIVKDEAKKMEDAFIVLKNFYKNNFPFNEEVWQEKQNKQDNKIKNSKKFKKKDELIMKHTSFATEHSDIYKDEVDPQLMSQLQIFEAQFLTSLSKCSQNTLLASVFSALVFCHKKEVSLLEIKNRIKHYESMVSAINSNNSKALKKLVDFIFP